ncbi:MAG: hypothetical protein ACXW16_09185, partial [Burkholderiaceae bacterium]
MTVQAPRQGKSRMVSAAKWPTPSWSFEIRRSNPVIWDNPSLLHSATLTDPTDPRTLWRMTIRDRGQDMKRRLFIAAVAAAIALPAGAQTITLNGASQFNDDHAFTK